MRRLYYLLVFSLISFILAMVGYYIQWHTHQNVQRVLYIPKDATLICEGHLNTISLSMAHVLNSNATKALEKLERVQNWINSSVSDAIPAAYAIYCIGSSYSALLYCDLKHKIVNQWIKSESLDTGLIHKKDDIYYACQKGYAVFSTQLDLLERVITKSPRSCIDCTQTDQSTPTIYLDVEQPIIFQKDFYDELLQTLPQNIHTLRLKMQTTPQHVLLHGTGLGAQKQTKIVNSKLTVTPYLPSSATDILHIALDIQTPILSYEFVKCILPKTLFGTQQTLILMHVKDALDIMEENIQAVQTWVQNFTGKKFIHYTTVDDWIILGESDEALVYWRMQYEQKQTWSEHHIDFLSGILEFAHSSSFKQTESKYIGIQVVQESKDYTVSIIKQQKDRCTQKPYSSPGLQQLDVQIAYAADSVITTQPFILKSHRSDGGYIMFQDKNHQVYFLAPNGKLLWKKKLEASIIGKVLTIDFYKNGKLQYLIATKNVLHLLDYYGRETEGYPQCIPKNTTYIQVLDYAHTRDYRILLATESGLIYLRDKLGGALPGWNPKDLGNAFTQAPFHQRIRGKDYIIAPQRSRVHVLTRNGVLYPNTPIKLPGELNTHMFFDKQHALVGLTDAQELIRLNITQPKIDSQKLPPGKWMIYQDQVQSKNYIRVHQCNEQIKIFSETDKLLTTCPGIPGKSIGAYYAFSGQQYFYVFTDLDRSFSQIYDSDGRCIHATPIINAHPIGLVFHQRQKLLEIHVCHDKQYFRYQVSLL